MFLSVNNSANHAFRFSVVLIFDDRKDTARINEPFIQIESVLVQPILVQLFRPLDDSYSITDFQFAP